MTLESRRPRWFGHRPPPGTSSERCHARRTNGEPCQAWAMYGSLVCVVHGGMARQVRKAANRRLTDAALRMLAARMMARHKRDGLPLPPSLQPPEPPEPRPQRDRTPRLTPEQQAAQLADSEQEMDEFEADLAAGRIRPWPGLPGDAT